MFLWDAAAAYYYARLLVVRANRAVTVFAMFCFLPQPFIAVFAVLFLSIPLRCIAFNHTTKHFIFQARVPPFISQTTFHKFHFVCSFSRHTYPTRKKTTLHSKNSASPAVNGSRPQALHSGLSAADALSPLATACASPYCKQKKSRLYVPPIFHLPPVGSRLLYLICFPLRPRTVPDHPPKKTVEFLFDLRYHAGF
jgi:hypothetical protein